MLAAAAAATFREVVNARTVATLFGGLIARLAFFVVAIKAALRPTRFDALPIMVR